VIIGTASAPPADYTAAVAGLRAAYAALPPGAPVRLAKKTSNLFRPRVAAGQRLDASAFTGVLAVDVEARTCDVLGLTTYEQLLDATLAHGLMPLVVPQLKTITIGGAVTGLGIESSSFRNGLPHESVLEMDVLTGDGRVVTASATENPELLAGFPNSYGTLGYALRLRIELEPVAPYVHLVHERFTDSAALTARLTELCAATGQGRPDFLDGVAFSPTELYLTVARWSATTPRPPSDYTRTGVFYRSLQERSEDWLTVRDYLWRWDTDWFWCSRVFGVQDRPWLRRLLGRRWLRSTTWWRLVGLEQRFGAKAAWDRRHGLPERESVVQDVEVPAERLPEMLAFLDAQTQIRPVWVCPLGLRDERQWPLYPMAPGTLWVNVGFWSTVALPPGEGDGFHNRAIEREVTRLGGHKSLYSTSFYSREEFATLYGGAAYAALKHTWDPAGRLLDLYDKTVGRR